MISWLWLIPALPFVSATLLMLFGSSLSRRAVAAVGVGSIGLSALVTALIAVSFVTAPPAGHAYTQVLWTWISVAGFQPQIGLYLDALSLVMILVVTFVGFLIHIYSAEFMIEDEGYSRYFAYMNLFVASMLTLLLGNNLLLLLLGWEGVGLCSYLLIGFWYRDPANGRAARKAFIVTRVGDCALMVGIVLAVHAAGHAADSGSDAARFRAVALGIHLGACGGSLAVGRCRGQIGADSAAGVVARCDGWPDANQRADPRGHHGDGGRLSDRAHARSVLPRSSRAVGRGSCRCGHPVACRV